MRLIFILVVFTVFQLVTPEGLAQTNGAEAMKKAVADLMELYGAQCKDDSTIEEVARLLAGAPKDTRSVVKAYGEKFCQQSNSAQCLLSLDLAIGKQIREALVSKKCMLPDTWAIKVLGLACKKKMRKAEVNIQSSKACPFDLSECEDSSLGSSTFGKTNFSVKCKVPTQDGFSACSHLGEDIKSCSLFNKESVKLKDKEIIQIIESPGAQ